MENWDEKQDSDVSEFSFLVVPQCLIFERVSLGSLHYFLHSKQHHFSLKDSLRLLIQVSIILWCDSMIVISVLSIVCYVTRP